MARPLRIDYPGAFHHVMNRGANHQPIFTDVGDRPLFLSVLADTVRQWRLRIHAFALMDNHYHLLVESKLGNISRALRHLDGLYTQRYNRRHGRDGPLLRGRFKSILVERDSYFLELVRYIHLNGVRAGRCATPDDDRHASHRYYLRPQQAPWWLTRDTALDFFRDDSHGPLAALDRFVRSGLPPEVEKIIDGQRWPAVLGSPAFFDRIKDLVQSTPPQPEKSGDRALRRVAAPLEVVQAVEAAYRVKLTDLVRQSRKVKHEARQAAIHFLRTASHLTLGDIGRLVGGLKRSQVSRLCRLPLRPMSPVWERVRLALEGKRET